MQNTSALYKSIIANDHYFEYKLDIDGVGSFPQETIEEMKTHTAMFDGTPEIGNAVAGEIDVVMLKPETDIPRMAVLRPYVRACNDTQKSEWLAQGVYYVDTRQETHNGRGLDTLTLHGYDAMLKAERYFESAAITGDSVDAVMVGEIARIMGVSVDARTYALMNKAYTVPLPTGYTLREVLGYIAAMYVGCFVMSETGKLRLVSILELPPETNYLVDNNGDAITFGGDRILV